jgi:DNA-binding LacI/PurR family transcriptional regulator
MPPAAPVTPAARRVTLKRIAEEAGVSVMTVSNAFNRPDQLSPALRVRILDLAEALGYAGPDPLARGLRRGRAGAIGLVSDTNLSYAFADPAASAVLAGLCAATEADGLGLLLVPGGGPAPVLGAVVDGVAVYSVGDEDPVLAQALARRLPVVVIDQPVVPDVPRVGIDDEAAARAAAAHVTGLGHRRPAVVSFSLAPGDPARPSTDLATAVGLATYAVTRARLAGYAAALRDAGIDPAGVPVADCGGSDRTAGRAAAARLLASDPPPTAVLATSDVLALGVLDAAAAAGRTVPGQLSVAGFDDVPAALTAGLTTVRQDHHRKGRVAGELLLAALGGAASGQPGPLPHELVVRDSTAPPGG